MTPKGARKAGRARLPGRVPYIPFPINSENAGLVRHVGRCSIDRRHPLQAPVGELVGDLLLDGSAVEDEVQTCFGRCIADGRVRCQFPD